jgi:hypothetical protein
MNSAEGTSFPRERTLHRMMNYRHSMVIKNTLNVRVLKSLGEEALRGTRFCLTFCQELPFFFHFHSKTALFLSADIVVAGLRWCSHSNIYLTFNGTMTLRSYPCTYNIYSAFKRPSNFNTIILCFCFCSFFFFFSFLVPLAQTTQNRRPAPERQKDKNRKSESSGSWCF